MGICASHDPEQIDQLKRLIYQIRDSQKILQEDITKITIQFEEGRIKARLALQNELITNERERAINEAEAEKKVREQRINTEIQEGKEKARFQEIHNYGEITERY